MIPRACSVVQIPFAAALQQPQPDQLELAVQSAVAVPAVTALPVYMQAAATRKEANSSSSNAAAGPVLGKARLHAQHLSTPRCHCYSLAAQIAHVCSMLVANMYVWPSKKSNSGSCQLCRQFC